MPTLPTIYITVKLDRANCCYFLINCVRRKGRESNILFVLPNIGHQCLRLQTQQETLEDIILTRMHSSRMRTVRSSSRLLEGSVLMHAGIHPPAPVWASRPPCPPVRPINLPLGVGLETPHGQTRVKNITFGNFVCSSNTKYCNTFARHRKRNKYSCNHHLLPY